MVLYGTISITTFGARVGGLKALGLRGRDLALHTILVAHHPNLRRLCCQRQAHQSGCSRGNTGFGNWSRHGVCFQKEG
jgi:hypothetical protein